MRGHKILRIVSLAEVPNVGRSPAYSLMQSIRNDAILRTSRFKKVSERAISGQTSQTHTNFLPAVPRFFNKIISTALSMDYRRLMFSTIIEYILMYMSGNPYVKISS